MHDLYEMYRDGRGVPKNAKEAARWRDRAYASGYVPPKLLLDLIELDQLVRKQKELKEQQERARKDKEILR
jgi:TPR repeat protein